MHTFSLDGRRYSYSERSECLGRAVEAALITRAALLDKSAAVTVDVYHIDPRTSNSSKCYTVTVSPSLAVTVTNY